MTNFKFGVRVLDFDCQPVDREGLSRLNISHTQAHEAKVRILKESEIEGVLESFSTKEELLLIRCDIILDEYRALEIEKKAASTSSKENSEEPYRYLLIENVVGYCLK